MKMERSFDGECYGVETFRWNERCATIIEPRPAARAAGPALAAGIRRSGAPEIAGRRRDDVCHGVGDQFYKTNHREPHLACPTQKPTATSDDAPGTPEPL